MTNPAVATPDQDAKKAPRYIWGIVNAIAVAEMAGMEVVRSTETTLLLDLDTGAAQDQYRRMFKSIGSVYGLNPLRQWQSKSGVGLHVVLTCSPMSFQERVALQACLGSDPVREALAIAMAADGHENPSVLFKPATEVSR